MVIIIKLHSFSVEAAVRYGLTEAVVLQCLSQWLAERTDDADYGVQNGCAYLKLTVKQFQGELSYFSPFKIKTALDNLQVYKLITIRDGEFNEALIRRRYMSYSLTSLGLALTQKEDV